MDTFDKVPPHGLVRDWLGDEAVKRLLAYARSNEHLFNGSEVFKETKDVDELDHTRRISRRLGLGELKSEIKSKFQELLPVMFETLRIQRFTPTFELELVAHGDGAFFARHMDTLKHRHRIISAVYYFYALPKMFSGGALRLHSLAASGDQGTFIDISPDYDTVVFFPSMFPHEVLTVKSRRDNFLGSRFAINCWVVRQPSSDACLAGKVTRACY
jgi:SM-20-related protein